MKLYKRAYQLLIGNDKESMVVEGLRVSFDITKTISQDPNPATFTIINLSPQNRNLITSKVYDRILLNAGYEGDLRTLFVGYIDTVENRKETVDILTVLTCSDGQKDYRESRTAVTVAKGATDKEIVETVLKDMPNTGSGTRDLPKEKQLPRGKTLVGNSRDVLKSVASNQDADWSIQDGQLLMLPKDKALPNTEGFLIKEGTGMVGSPQKTNDGLEVRCFLNNAMKIGQLCRVESALSEYSGDYKITKLNMRGDIFSAEWYSILTVQGGEFQEVAG